jgi:hypothetical protein
MNWEALSAIAEIIGVFAVVVSLIYVSIQIRQNTKVARAATRQAIADSTQNLANDLLNSGEMAEIFVKHINGEELSAADNLRLQARCYRDLQHWENIHYQFSEGLVSPDQWRGFRKNLVELLGVTAYREFWEHEASHFSDRFQAEMHSILKECESACSEGTIASRFKISRGS